MLKSIYQGSNKHCYDSLHLTKRSFVDLCAILHERCGLTNTFYVSVEESVTMCYPQVQGSYGTARKDEEEMDPQANQPMKEKKETACHRLKVIKYWVSVMLNEQNDEKKILRQ